MGRCPTQTHTRTTSMSNPYQLPPPVTAEPKHRSNNHKKNPFKRPEYLVAHWRATHGGQPSDSRDAVIQDGLRPTTTASELKSNEETPLHRYRRSGPEEGCQNPPGEDIKPQIEAVRAESFSIRTMFVSQSVEIESLKTQLSQIRTQANNLSIGS